MRQGRGVGAALGGAVALASVVVTITAGVAPPAQTVPALLVPAMFVLAGLLGPLWDAARFTCRLLVAVGALHLAGIALSAVAQAAPAGSAWLHLLSQLAYTGGFALLLPLAHGYPASRAARWPWIVGGDVLLLPVLGALAAPTPAVLQPDGPVRLLGPVVPLLPPGVAALAAAVFLLPVAAVAVAGVRAVRDGREARRRLAVPLAALVLVTVLLLLGAVLPPAAAGVTSALFLVSAPLVPAGLVAGSRPAPAPDEPPAVPAVSDEQLARLSPRERDVLAAMAAGESNAAIAARLHLSISAVEKHTTAVFTKLGLAPDAGTHRRVAAVVAYLRSAR